VPFLLYSKDATDITALLLKELNKDAPAESAVPPGTTPAPEEALTPKATVDPEGGQ
jgi:hypothetical protein